MATLPKAAADMRPAREALGFSLEELFDRSGCSGWLLELIERGRYPMTSVVYDQVAPVLGWPQRVSDCPRLNVPPPTPLSEAKTQLRRAERLAEYAMTHGSLTALDLANRDIAFWLRRLEELQAREEKEPCAGG